MNRAVNCPQTDASQRSQKSELSGADVISFPSLRSSAERTGRPEQFVSDAEVAQLVSVALENAMAALGDRDPETFLRLRACEARAGIRETLSTTGWESMSDKAVVREYRRAVVFQNLALDLALKLVSSIRHYARVSEREMPSSRA